MRGPLIISPGPDKQPLTTPYTLFEKNAWCQINGKTCCKRRDRKGAALWIKVTNIYNVCSDSDSSILLCYCLLWLVPLRSKRTSTHFKETFFKQSVPSSLDAHPPDHVSVWNVRNHENVKLSHGHYIHPNKIEECNLYFSVWPLNSKLRIQGGKEIKTSCSVHLRNLYRQLYLNRKDSMSQWHTLRQSAVYQSISLSVQSPIRHFLFDLPSE